PSHLPGGRTAIASSRARWRASGVASVHLTSDAITRQPQSNWQGGAEAGVIYVIKASGFAMDASHSVERSQSLDAASVSMLRTAGANRWKPPVPRSDAAGSTCSARNLGAI
ncbi:hypothetical protein, partial [Mesorhizobium sp. B1-1-5]|uniref:hypothetical protein n=1 Tax=Mesorhizobium sp. B1-1-5 TaxID=2589979 RepID=UPI001AEF0E56